MTLFFLVLEKSRTSYAAGGMTGQHPFNFNQTGLNLLPSLGSPLGNPQQLLSQLQGLRAPQSNMGLGSFGQESYGRQRMQTTDDRFRRELRDFNHRERSLREPYMRSQGRDNYSSEIRDRVRGLMDKEVPVDFLFPEMGSKRNEEKYGRENNGEAKLWYAQQRQIKVTCPI